MKRNAIHWGLLALSLLCGGALHLEATSTARAGASNTPWGTIIATLPATAGSPFAINPKTNAVYSVSSDGKADFVLDGTTNQVTAQIPIPGGVNGTWFDARQDRLLRPRYNQQHLLRHRNRCEDKLDHQHDLPRPTAR